MPSKDNSTFYFQLLFTPAAYEEILYACVLNGL